MKIGDQVQVINREHPLAGEPCTIVDEDEGWFQIKRQESTFWCWVRPEEIEPFVVEKTPLMSEQDLLFAQMRGILLHLGSAGIWDAEQAGPLAAQVFRDYGALCGCGPLVGAFNKLQDGEYLFTDYWNSWAPDPNAYEEPDVDDGFPMWLEYDDDGQRTPLEEWYPEYSYGED